MAFLIGGANSDSGAYQIENSLRFNDDDSPKLAITPGSAGNRKIFTISFWVKRGNITDQMNIFGTASEGDALYFASDDKLRFFQNGSASSYLGTNRLFRDPAAWYHIVVAVDTNQGTAANRVKLYINGSSYGWDASTTYPAEDYEGDINNTADAHMIGNAHHNDYFDGYLSEFYFIDGTQYAASNFGEADEDTGIWIPKNAKNDLTFGTNGFFLEFKETGTSANASGMGADTSGNGNHLTPTNLAAHDVCTDTPQNNFATMNPISQYGITFAEGNLSVQGANSSGYSVCTGTWEVPRYGKWYYEVEVDVFGGTNHEYIGIKRSDLQLEAGAYDLHSSTCQWYQSTDGSNGSFRDESTTTATATALRHSAGDILMVAIDMDSDKMWFGKNGTWYDDDATTDGDPAAGSNQTCTPNNGYTWHFFSGGGNNAVKYLYNFGNPPFSISSGNSDANDYGNFEYAVPSGFYALCTKNLAEYGGN